MEACHLVSKAGTIAPSEQGSEIGAGVGFGRRS